MSDDHDGDEQGQIPVLGDVMGFPDDQPDDERRWIVLYPEDFDNFGRDPEGNLAVLVDQQQAGEILQLAAETVAALSPRDAEGDDVLKDMIAELERQVGDGDE